MVHTGISNVPPFIKKMVDSTTNWAALNMIILL